MEALCDRACMIKAGTITRCVSLAEVFRLGEGMVEIAARGCTASDIEPVAEYLHSCDINGEEAFLLVRKQELVRTVIQHLYNSGAEVLRVLNHHPSLEDVFIGEMNGTPDGQRREDVRRHHARSEAGGGAL
jgi:ABC-type multidrug transport system ATPase subunit